MPAYTTQNTGGFTEGSPVNIPPEFDLHDTYSTERVPIHSTSSPSWTSGRSLSDIFEDYPSVVSDMNPAHPRSNAPTSTVVSIPPPTPTSSTKTLNAPWSKLKSKFKKKQDKIFPSDEQSVKSSEASTKSKKKPSEFYYPSARSRANPRSNKSAALAIKRPKQSKSTTPSEAATSPTSPECTSPTQDLPPVSSVPLRRPERVRPSQVPYPLTDEFPLPPPRPTFTSEKRGAPSSHYAPSSSGYVSPDPSEIMSVGSPRAHLHPQLASPSNRPIRKGHSKLDTYPLNPYDTSLLKADEHTNHLLRRLTIANSPSFHAYGNFPPASVLDLGCGEGHWLLDAARAWAGFGTTMTGIDAVDITRSMWPKAESLGVDRSIKVVKGNFIRDALPFPDNTFDLVRLGNMSLAIPLSQWDWVLREAYRVCSVGGRLELIDDSIVFPPTDTDGDAGATARDLETLWGEMLKNEYQLHLNPSEFLHGLLEDVFGHSRRVAVLQLTSTRDAPLGSALKPRHPSPGLMVWPTNVFLPMSNQELDVHASKYPKILLSCKRSLVEYVSSLNRPRGLPHGHDSDHLDHQEEDGDVVLEAIWEYENGLSERVQPPALGESGPPQPHRPLPNLSGLSLTSEHLSSAEEITNVHLRPSHSKISLTSSSNGNHGSQPPSYARVQRETLTDIPEAVMRGKHVKTMYVWEALKMGHAFG